MNYILVLIVYNIIFSFRAVRDYSSGKGFALIITGSSKRLSSHDLLN